MLPFLMLSGFNLQEKVKYYDIATEKRAEFDLAMANFTKKMVKVYFQGKYILPSLDISLQIEGKGMQLHASILT